jgi:uncharacterized protein (TIGR00159 family)
LPSIRWQSVVDFLVLAAAFYALLRWSRQARALRLALGVVSLHAAALLASHLDLVVTSWVLDASAILAIALLLLIFQPELRRAIMRLDGAVRLLPRPVSILADSSQAIATAAFEMAQARLGALVVIIQKDSIAELLDGGLALEAEISSQLLEAIFQKASPLHDGAVIIKGNRIAQAGVVLPLTQRRDVPILYGTRHRAGMGLAERSDALVTVVSEERGEVTLMAGGEIRLAENQQQLMQILRHRRRRTRQSLSTRIRRILFANSGLKFAALGLACFIWSLSFLTAGASIRTVSVPVEFSNVPVGMKITEQPADVIEVQLRGSAWIMDSVNLEKLIAHFDLGNYHPGSYTLRLAPGTLDLPPGVKVERATPETIHIRIERSEAASPR